MKKLFVFAVASLFAFSISAQTFGVKAGYNMSGYKVNFYTPDGAAMGSGIYAGLVAEMPINDMVSLKADVMFRQLGSEFDSRNNSDEDWALGAAGIQYDTKTDVNYLQIGISPKFNFGPAYAFVGPYFGYAVNSNKEGTWEGVFPLTPAPGTGSSDIFDDVSTTFNPAEAFSDDNNNLSEGDLYNTVDFGLNLGFGATFSGVFVELNVGLGMANFVNTDSDYYSITDFYDIDDKTVNITDDAKQNNLFFGLAVGYMLGGE